MIARERRKLLLDQSEARSFDKAALKKVSKNISKSSILFNENFKIVYDKKAKRILLEDEQIYRDTKRFKALSTPQAVILKAIKNTLGKFKKSVTVFDLLSNLDDSWNENMILTVLRILVKKHILEEEEIEIQDRKISVFKVI